MAGLTVRPTQLSARQRAVLVEIVRYRLISGPQLVIELDDLGAPEQGVHQTASSLVRRGLAEKVRQHGRVWYRATDAGRAVIS